MCACGARNDSCLLRPSPQHLKEGEGPARKFIGRRNGFGLGAGAPNRRNARRQRHRNPINRRRRVDPSRCRFSPQDWHSTAIIYWKRRQRHKRRAPCSGGPVLLHPCRNISTMSRLAQLVIAEQRQSSNLPKSRDQSVPRKCGFEPDTSGPHTRETSGAFRVTA